MGSSRSTTAESTDERLNSSVASQTANNHRRQKVQEVEGRHDKRLLVASDPALQAVVDTHVLLGGLVEVLLGEHSALLDIEAELE